MAVRRGLRLGGPGTSARPGMVADLLSLARTRCDGGGRVVSGGRHTFHRDECRKVKNAARAGEQTRTRLCRENNGRLGEYVGVGRGVELAMHSPVGCKALWPGVNNTAAKRGRACGVSKREYSHRGR